MSPIRAADPWLDAVKGDQALHCLPAPIDGWTNFTDELITYPASEEVLAKLQRAAIAIRNIRSRHAVTDADTDAISAVLTDVDGGPSTMSTMR